MPETLRIHLWCSDLEAAQCALGRTPLRGRLSSIQGGYVPDGGRLRILSGVLPPPGQVQWRTSIAYGRVGRRERPLRAHAVVFFPWREGGGDGPPAGVLLLLDGPRGFTTRVASRLMAQGFVHATAPTGAPHGILASVGLPVP